MQELLRAGRIRHCWRIAWTRRDNLPQNFPSGHFFHRHNHFLHRRTVSSTQFKRRISRLQVLQRLDVRFR